METGTTRREEDLLGALEIPAEVYWGIHTARAIRNFPLSGRPVRPALIRALALVKKACAAANLELGYLPPEKGEAIIKACAEIAAGGLSDQFPVDALQGGAGTSTNMNVNEVIANRAIELLGGRKGDYHIVHPLEDVNLHQSTNDVYPTALRVAAITGLRRLGQAVADLQGAFQEREKAFGSVVTIGRTELQEAVPMTLGAEFAGFAEAFSRDRWRTAKSEERLRVVNLGGTAIGTGLAAPAGLHLPRHRKAPGGDGDGAQPGGEPHRGDGQRRPLRRGVGHPQGARRKPRQDRGRPAPPQFHRGDPPPPAPGRLVDHAGQGEPGPPRGDHPDGAPRHGRTTC